MNYYPHQIRVAELVLAGKNIILQAPTGAGKTRAALLPYLESMNTLSDVHGVLPTKCIYSVPMRVLANQFQKAYQKDVDSYAKRDGLDPITVKIQTGETSEDKQFAANLIFATIDQTLSSFLISPYSLSRRQANLNAGAVAGSYLIFDEFHLFDPDSTLPTSLHMLKMLKEIVPFVLMTATFSQNMLAALADELDAVVVGNSPEERAEFADLPSQKKVRFYHTVDDLLTAEAVLDKHQRRSLVICNTVERARKLFEDISEMNPNAEVLLLHSQLLGDDRKARENSIRTHFGQGNHDGDFIVVSTQAIEVGVDMSSTALHTELAPANAIIQRAGRCARYEREKGDIFIYAQALKKGEVVDLREDVLPYQGQGKVITKTWEAFEGYCGQALNFDAEQTILSHAHAEQDARIVQTLREGSRNHRQSIYAVMRGDTGSDAKNLIRQVIAQPITIHSNPHEVAKNPFVYPSFSLHPGTVQKMVEAWLDERENDWQVAVILENDKEFEHDSQANEERYYAEKVNDKKAGWMARLLVVHPSLATYDEILGLVTDRGGVWEAALPEKAASNQEGRNYGYQLESYERHIELVYKAFKEYWPESLWAASRLEQRFGWAEGSVTKAAELAVLLHDVGKLSKDWQNWVRKYQAAIVKADLDKAHPTEKGQVYAHTDYRSDDVRYQEIQRASGKRAWHAVEGALAVLPIVADALKNPALSQAVISAIARHHAAHSDSYGDFQLDADSIKHIRTTLPNNLSLDLGKLLGLTTAIQTGYSDPKRYIAEPNDESGAYLAYLLIVRALRRADGRGTERGALEP